MGLQDVINWYNRALPTRRARVAAVSAVAACVLLMSVSSLSRLSSIDGAAVSTHLEPMQVPWQQLSRPQESLGPSQINRHFPSKARMVVRVASVSGAAAVGTEWDWKWVCTGSEGCSACARHRACGHHEAAEDRLVVVH